MAMLGLASVLGLAMLAGRVALSRQYSHLYLPWNLFLAWLPVGLALAIRHLEHRWPADRWRLRLLAAIWVLFLPNAPYLLTDLVHLPSPGRRYYFADLMLILHFALVGLILGAVALHLVHEVVERRWGWARGWLLTLGVALLSGLGVYVGRFLRWNSWDPIVRPAKILGDGIHWLGRVWERPSELILPALFGSTMLVAYLLFSSLLRSSFKSSFEISDELVAEKTA